MSKGKTLRKSVGKNRKTVVLVVVVLLLTFGWLVYRGLAQNYDKQRFTAAEEKKLAITSALKSYLGNKVTSTEERNLCFNTEQGPYDNGKLWCQTATVIRLTEDVSYTELGKEYLEIGQSYGKKDVSESNLFPRYGIEMPEGISCQLSFRGSSDKNYGNAAYIPYDDHEQPVVAVSCADRAKAKHYTYRD